MSTIAIGDVHGNRAALDDLLAKISPDLSSADEVIFLGDYIDRGPDSKGCVDAILEFKARVPSLVVCLMGNHEDWFLKTRDDYREHSWLLAMDAVPTISSYSAEAADAISRAMMAARRELFKGTVTLPYESLFEAIPKAHAEFFDGLVRWHENDDCIAAHAGIDTRGKPLASQPSKALVWGWSDGGFPRSYAGKKVVVYGHRNNAVLDGDDWPSPNIRGRTVGLDTISHGVLSAFRMPDNHVIQSARFLY
jgi:serine/threonine protein phosphatase 1